MNGLRNRVGQAVSPASTVRVGYIAEGQKKHTTIFVLKASV